jgi:hypothetical protein
LISTYGKRATQIIESPGGNPTESEQYGPFAAFVGADGTSIWAAATSGDAAIAIHMLACILARAFDDAVKATSVWAELVVERQRETKKIVESSTLSVAKIAAINAANQDIPREELRQWDASARAWLQSADKVVTEERTQLQLILKNISLPVTQGPSFYEGVVRAWTQAMVGLERLLSGEPQSITDGSILLALSAWNLYPKLLVLSSKPTRVEFNDPLTHPAGVLTIGITNGSVNGRRGGSDSIAQVDGL